MKSKLVSLIAFSTLLLTVCFVSSLTLVSCKKEVVTTEQKIVTPTVVAPETASSETTVATPTTVPASNVKQTEMVFTEEVHDFGTISQGDKVNHFFTFKNTGTNDLMITRAAGSCGCTVPEFPKEPIAPGKTGTMKVTFNSTGKSGAQEKSVTVFANVPGGTKIIKIKANIKVK